MYTYDRREAATQRQVEYAWSLLSRVDWERSGISKKFRGMKEKPDKVSLSKMSTPRLSKLIDVLKQHLQSGGASNVSRSNPGSITPRQIEYILKQVQELGSTGFQRIVGYQAPTKDSIRKWSLNGASQVIDALKRAEKSHTAPKQRPPSKGRPATPRQINYAMNLLHRLGPHGWHDSDWGQGMDMPRREDLEKWPASEVSALIDSLRDEF